jgi:putative ABC transport system permease protein
MIKAAGMSDASDYTEEMAALRRDLQHALRLMRSRPTPALLAIAAIALGIGVSSAVFSIFNAVLVRDLPYREPERLVMLWNTNDQAGITLRQQKTQGRSLSLAEYRDWQGFTGAFDRMIIFGSFLTRLGKTDDPEIVFGYQSAPGFFPLLGVSPLLGRGFAPEDEREGANPVLVLQYEFWKRRFHGDSGVLGKTVYLDNRAITVVGVMPPEFVFFNRQIDFVSTATWRYQDVEKRRGDRYFRAMARLKPGLSLAEAQTRADAFSAALAQQHPDTNRNWRVVLVPIAEDTAGELRPAMLVLLAAVGCVLLITCANVTNLLLVQASARSKELAVRVAMGAGRLRLMRQLLTESLLLSIPGGALGLGLAYGIIQYFRTLRPDRFSHGKYLLQAEAIRIDFGVVAFAIGVTLLSALVFGLVPGLRATRPDLNNSLKDISRGSVGGRQGRVLRNSLVIAEVTVTVVLVVGAALLVRSFLALYDRGPGFRPERLVSMEVTMSWEDVEDEIKAKNLSRDEAQKAYMAADRSFRQRLYRELSSVPGLDTFTAVQTIPLSSYYSLSNITIEGRPPEAPGHEPRAIFNNVRANYFELLGIPLLAGRFFGPEDRPVDRFDAPRSVIVSQELVHRYFSGQNPIGKHMRWGDSSAPVLTITGIVGDIREDGMDRPPQPYFYLNEEQAWFPGYLIVRAKGDPMALMPSIRQAIRKADARAAVYRVLRMGDIVRASAWRLNYSMLLLGSLAAIALVLAMVGVYGVLSYSVRERTQEIGVRMALGANRPQVLSLVLRQGLTSVGTGIAIGLLASAILTRFLQTLLFGVTPLDGGTFVIVALALLIAGGMASYLPALRAAALDPMVALRHE